MNGWAGQNRRNRSRTDDASETIRDHEASRIARQVKACREIDREDASEIRVSPLGEGGPVLHAGIIDEDVELAVAFGDGLERGAAGGRIGDVERCSLGAIALPLKFICRGIESCGVSCAEDR